MRRLKDWPAQATAPGDLPLLLDFVNSRDFESDTEAWTSPETLAHWLERHGYLAAATALGDDDLERALSVRRKLRTLLGANTGRSADAPDLAELDQVAAEACCRVRFDDDGAIRFDPGPGGLDGALGRLFGILALAKLEDRWPRLKICANASCRRAFYDASNNRRARWCAMRRCGNKINAHSYRRRYRRAHGYMPHGGRIPGLK